LLRQPATQWPAVQIFPEPSLPGLHWPSPLQDAPVPEEPELLELLELEEEEEDDEPEDELDEDDDPEEAVVTASMWRFPLMVESTDALLFATQMSMRERPLFLNAPPVSTTRKSIARPYFASSSWMRRCWP